MVREIDGRIILRACLDSILNGQDIDKNVSDAEKTLRKYANFAQSTQDFLRTRPGSRFLEETLEYADLPHIGHYQGNRRVEGAYRVIAFQQNGHSVEFFFKEEDLTEAEMVEKIAKRKKVDEEALRVMTMNILRRDYLGGPIENSGEVIDEEMRTLDFYALEHVDIVKEKPRVVLGFELPAFPVRQRETIYRKDSA